MLGWEFPPYFAGGVGIVCYELTKVFASMSDIEVEYVMAYGPDSEWKSPNLQITSVATQKELKEFSSVSISKIPTLLHCYNTPQSYEQHINEVLKKSQHQSHSQNKSVKQIYGENILEEVYLYAQRVATKYQNQNFDVIHAHDWTTVPAALLLKKLTGKPVVFHVHITELDKTGGNGGFDKIFEIERKAFRQADILVPVSNFVKNRLINDYGVDPSKIRVIHNGGISDMSCKLKKFDSNLNKHPIILFAGRITLQKGPEYFIKAAKKVIEYEPEARFIVAGSGDMLPYIIELSAELGISKNILFHGKYSRYEADLLFSMADCFVMPSVSEPFGIVPLEAISKGTPTIISKQSGISEVLENTFKVDFWDIDEMAHKMLSIIRYKPLKNHMGVLGHYEFKNFCWTKPANKFKQVYNEAVENVK